MLNTVYLWTHGQPAKEEMSLKASIICTKLTKVINSVHCIIVYLKLYIFMITCFSFKMGYFAAVSLVTGESMEYLLDQQK